MAISKEDKSVLTAVFGEETADKISGAIADDMSFGLRLNGKVYTPEEQTTIKETAIQQGRELGYKEVAKTLEITLDAGEKNPVSIAEKLKTSLSAVYEQKYKNLTPSDEIIALAKKAGEFEDKNKTLLETLKSKELEAGEWQSKYTEKEHAIREEKINNKILASFPDKMAQDKSDALLIIRNSIEFDESDGVMVAKIKGRVQTNAFAEPETIENVIKQFVEAKKGWIHSAGMGGGNRGGNSDFGLRSDYSPEEAHRLLLASKTSPSSPEGLKMFSAMIKDYKKK